MNNYFLSAEEGIKQLCKKYVGKPVTAETSDSLASDIADYVLPKDTISIELRRSSKGKYYVYPGNLYTLLILKGIVLPYQLVDGKDTIHIADRTFSFIDGKCSIKPTI